MSTELANITLDALALIDAVRRDDGKAATGALRTYSHEELLVLAVDLATIAGLAVSSGDRNTFMRKLTVLRRQAEEATGRRA